LGGVCTASPAHVMMLHPAINEVMRVLIIRFKLLIVLWPYRPLRPMPRFSFSVVGLSTHALSAVRYGVLMKDSIKFFCSLEPVLHWYRNCKVTLHSWDDSGENDAARIHHH
jgi:hypothetical protein